MSNTLPQAHPSVLQLHWRALSTVVALLLVATAFAVYLVASDDDGAGPAPAVHSIRSAGPDETLRGQAAASAAGARPIPQSGGPDETLRGRAASQATR